MERYLYLMSMVSVETALAPPGGETADDPETAEIDISILGSITPIGQGVRPTSGPDPG